MVQINGSDLIEEDLLWRAIFGSLENRDPIEMGAVRVFLPKTLCRFLIVRGVYDPHRPGFKQLTYLRTIVPINND